MSTDGDHVRKEQDGNLLLLLLPQIMTTIIMRGGVCMRHKRARRMDIGKTFLSRKTLKSLSEINFKCGFGPLNKVNVLASGYFFP